MKSPEWVMDRKSHLSKMERELEKVEFSGSNPLLHWTGFRNPLRVLVNALVLEVSGFLPMKLKNRVLEILGVEIGEKVAIGYKAMFDIFHPEKISIGSGSTIGYNTTILTHETTTDEFRFGRVEIGENVLIGANTTVLPGVKIGDDAKVSANSVVNRDVEEGEFVGGVPIRSIDSE